MKDRKAIGKKLLFPPLWLIIILTVFSAVALVAVFVKGWETHPVAYVIYAFPAGSLCKEKSHRKTASGRA